MAKRATARGLADAELKKLLADDRLNGSWSTRTYSSARRYGKQARRGQSSGEIQDSGGTLLFSDERSRNCARGCSDPDSRGTSNRKTGMSSWPNCCGFPNGYAITNSKLGCRDEDDDKVLETALLGQADCLVSGDQDLLEMSPFQGIPIISPAELLRSKERERRRSDSTGRLPRRRPSRTPRIPLIEPTAGIQGHGPASGGPPGAHPVSLVAPAARRAGPILVTGMTFW